MAIRCGNKAAHDGETGEHDSIAQVRLCYHRRYAAEGRWAPPAPVPAPRPAPPVAFRQPAPVGGSLSYGGLTAWQVVAQSAAIHPDWDATMHAHYLVGEEGFAPGFVESLPIRAWLTDTTHSGYVGPKVAQLLGQSDPWTAAMAAGTAGAL